MGRGKRAVKKDAFVESDDPVDKKNQKRGESDTIHYPLRKMEILLTKK